MTFTIAFDWHDSLDRDYYAYSKDFSQGLRVKTHDEQDFQDFENPDPDFDVEEYWLGLKHSHDLSLTAYSTDGGDLVAGKFFDIDTSDLSPGTEYVDHYVSFPHVNKFVDMGDIAGDTELKIGYYGSYGLEWHLGDVNVKLPGGEIASGGYNVEEFGPNVTYFTAQYEAAAYADDAWSWDIEKLVLSKKNYKKIKKALGKDFKETKEAIQYYMDWQWGSWYDAPEGYHVYSTNEDATNNYFGEVVGNADGNDFLSKGGNGGDGWDIIIGGGNGGGGNDFILGSGKGGDGSDVIIGGGKLDGEKGNDIIVGDNGRNTLVSKYGLDDMFGGGGNDVFKASSKQGSHMDGQSGNDKFFSNKGWNYSDGGDGNDTFYFQNTHGASQGSGDDGKDTWILKKGNGSISDYEFNKNDVSKSEKILLKGRWKDAHDNKLVSTKAFNFDGAYLVSYDSMGNTVDQVYFNGMEEDSLMAAVDEFN